MCLGDAAFGGDGYRGFLAENSWKKQNDNSG
jgi:hypothetical protein